jgi:hypothetical protein
VLFKIADKESINNSKQKLKKFEQMELHRSVLTRRLLCL